jgi:hypothetical protein
VTGLIDSKMGREAASSRFMSWDGEERHSSGCFIIAGPDAGGHKEASDVKLHLISNEIPTLSL